MYKTSSKFLHSHSFALLGNPNCGKTTLFNQLTGSHQYVGNRAGVTVEAKKGNYKKNIEIVDLPGIYSLSTFSPDEKVAYDYLNENTPDIVINIVDATNLERNLYLTTQLLEKKHKIIIAVNMMDVLEKSGSTIDCEKLSLKLGVPVIPICANSGEGIAQLMKTAHTLANTFEERKNILNLSSPSARYNFITGILSDVVTKPADAYKLSDKIDKIVTNKYLAIPIFLIVMFLIFQITFSWLGAYFSSLVEFVIFDKLSPLIENSLSSINVSQSIISLLIDGIFAGVGSVLVFIPQILVLFFFLTILEDTGYIARVSFIMDRIFKKIGLSGKTCIPLILGFGCTVPAIMATRTIERERDRKITIFILPFISCGARLPVYTLIALAFFTKYQAIVIFMIYLLGIIVTTLASLLLSKTVYKNDPPAPLIVELAPYRMPTIKNISIRLWEKCLDFLKKAGTIIFAGSVIVWLLQNFTPDLQQTSDISASILGKIGQLISPIFAPLGFGSYQASTAVLTGIIAKEMVVSTLSIIIGTAASDTSQLASSLATVFTPAAALSFLTFVSLYVPCIATIGAIKRELGTKRATLAAILFQVTVAYIVSFVVYNVFKILL